MRLRRGRRRVARRRSPRPPARPRSRAAPPPLRGTCRQRRRGPSDRARESLRASLPIVVVFPVPLTPTTRITLGLPCEGERRRLAEERLDLLDERILEAAGDAARLEAPHELGRRRNSDVAADQSLLEPLPRLVVARVERWQTRAAPSARAGSSRATRASVRRSRSARARRPRSTRRRGAPPRCRLMSGAYAAASSCSMLVLRQPARDDLRHSVGAHRHAVEDVGGLHRPLLVRDDDELGTVGVAAQELDEARDVRVVERGLDLVEEVEGTRPARGRARRGTRSRRAPSRRPRAARGA